MSYRINSSSGPPGWFVFLLGIVFVFGLYYLWTGVQGYLSGEFNVTPEGEPGAEAPFNPEFVMREHTATPLPSATPLPECLDFAVSVSSAIVRSEPTTTSAILDTLPEGEMVCVIARFNDTEWFLVDRNRRTRRLETAYMHDDVIDALNPTPTPTDTVTPAPTITPLPTEPATITPIPTISPTRDPDITDTPTPSPTPTPTLPIISM